MRIAPLLLAASALTAPVSANDILVSTSPDRTNPIDVEGSVLAGDVYIFFLTATPESAIKSVEFFIDAT